MTDTESKWLARVAQWQASGLSLREFAAGREFKWTTLRYWRSKLRHKASPKGTEATGPAVRMARVVRSPTALADPTVAAGVLDRIVQNAYKLEVRGSSKRRERTTKPPDDLQPRRRCFAPVTWPDLTDHSIRIRAPTFGGKPQLVGPSRRCAGPSYETRPRSVDPHRPSHPS
jgi:hypothetical protein